MNIDTHIDADVVKLVVERMMEDVLRSVLANARHADALMPARADRLV